MNLSHGRFIYFDCQTSGMRPSSGNIIEMSWAFSSSGTEDLSVQSELVRLPDGRVLPQRVQDLTGITEEDLEGALSEEEVFHLFHQDVFKLQDPSSNILPQVVIHYAQFEKPFLQDLYLKYLGLTELPFEIICTYKIAKKLLPNLPTVNIKGLSGYFGSPIQELKRAEENVRASERIWLGLISELERAGIENLEELKVLLDTKKKATKKKFEYPLEKEKRLGLPDKPGIYKMIAKTGEVLYVGKATSLKDRVNSYFRGQKGRDRRKLEMLIQVWDIEVTVCENPVMAAIMENEEIKRLNPKYNISLKAGNRKLVFYSKDFVNRSYTQDDEHNSGPFRMATPIEQLRMLRLALGTNDFHRIFYDPIESSLLREGFLLHCEVHNLSLGSILSIRNMLAHGLLLLRASRKVEEEIAEVGEDDEMTAQKVCAKYERLFMRAAQDYLKSRLTNELLNAKVKWESRESEFEISIINGKISEEGPKPENELYPWRNLSLTDYDRLSILQSEINKYPHHIERL